jgi:hypothetical protein
MLRVAAALSLCVACQTSADGPGGGSGQLSDGGGSGGMVDAAKPIWADSANGSGSMLPCKNPVANPTLDGHHNTGKDCMQGCHNHGFTLSGTLYDSATSNSAFVGATVTITDAQNRTYDLVTAANGNFYTKNPITFPVKVLASSCPSAVVMVASVADGHCNTCHAQQGGSAGQMHLP